jgi:type IV pilus assembly protein PilB
MIVAQAPEAEVAAVAREEGMFTLREDGLAKVRSGLTSLEEVIRVTA